MSQAQTFSLAGPRNRKIHVLLHLPVGRSPAPVVVLCHGFKGFMEWGFFPAIADLLSDRGYAVARFNFTGSGMRPGDELVTDLEAFRNATFSNDLADLEALIGALGSEIGQGEVDPERLALLGHSRGGGTALLAAALPALEGRLRALVTWNGVSTFDRASAAEKTLLRREGEVPLVNARTGQSLAVGIEVLTDLESHAEQLDLQAAAARRSAPWLIVHGEQDETVPLAEGRLLAAAARQPYELEVIEGGSHTFGAVHPFAGPTPELILALNATQAWLRAHLD
jgi:dienelactone hydrolase